MSSWLCGKDKYPYSLQCKAKENWHGCWSHQSWEHAGEAQSCQSLEIKDTLPILISKILSSLSASICLFLLTFIFCYFFSSASFSAEPKFLWAEEPRLISHESRPSPFVCVCVGVFVPLFYGNPVLTRAYEGITPMNIRGSFTDTFPPYLSSQNTQEVKNFEISFSSTYTFFKGVKSQHWRGTSQLAGTWSTIPFTLPLFRSQTLVTPLTFPLLLVPDSPCTLPDQPQTWLILYPMSASLSLPPTQTSDRKQQFKRLSEPFFLEQRPVQQVPH